MMIAGVVAGSPATAHDPAGNDWLVAVACRAPMCATPADRVGDVASEQCRSRPTGTAKLDEKSDAPPPSPQPRDGRDQ